MYIVLCKKKNYIWKGRIIKRLFYKNVLKEFYKSCKESCLFCYVMEFIKMYLILIKYYEFVSICNFSNLN